MTSIIEQLDLAFREDLHPRDAHGHWIKKWQPDTFARNNERLGWPSEANRQWREHAEGVLRQLQHDNRRAAGDTWTADEQGQIIRHAHPGGLGRWKPAFAPPPPEPPSPNLPGDYIAPGIKQLVLPGMGDRVTEFGENSAPARKLRAEISGGALKAGETHLPEGDVGQQADTAVVTLPDGVKVIHKTGQNRLRADREELSYYVSQAVGARAPAVARVPGTESDLVEDFVPGTIGSRYLDETGDWDETESELESTSEGEQIGLLDRLISNSDRNGGNWIVTPDNIPVPIDHGLAQFDGMDYSEDDSYHFSDWISSTDGLPAEYVNDLRGKLEKIRPEFDRLGRSGWYASMMAVLGSLPVDQDYATISGQALELVFNPAELRDSHGKWATGKSYRGMKWEAAVGAPGQFMYHRTSQDNIVSMMKHGLKARASAGALPDDPDKMIYVTTDDRVFHARREWGVSGSEEWRKAELGPMLKIDVSGLPLVKDRTYKDGRAWMVITDISPDRINLHEQGTESGASYDNAGISGQALELGWRYNPAEARDPHGRWSKGAGYTVPDPARLNVKKTKSSISYPYPEDHPFFQAHPVSPAHILAAYEASTAQEKAQGMRWYADVHLLAAKMADGDAREGAILLAAYSPQASWPVNMLNSARAAEEHRALGPKDGLISGDMQANAQEALDGASVDEALQAPKTLAFARLIEHGGDAPDDAKGQVVIDRHALSVATGVRLPDNTPIPIGKTRYHEYVADQYREAARQLNTAGTVIAPHQLQAITWLHQQAANQAVNVLQAADVTNAENARAKGRKTMLKNAWARWTAYAGAEGLPLEPGTTSLANLVSDWFEAVELAVWEHELRDSHGRWTRDSWGSRADPLAPAAQHGPGTRSKRIRPVITAAEARGNSRPVSFEEFQHLAAIGNRQIDQMKRDSSPATGLDEHWGEIKAATFARAQLPWGGATIDSHTGEALPDGADKYALSVKPAHMHTVSVPEDAGFDEFSDAMNHAKSLFRPALERRSFYLGVFHDDENNRIDIDPVVVVDTPDEVETIGSYTRAIGGAYHFKTGDGYWPPHVAGGADMASQEPWHWKGPGQWRTNADEVQDPEPEEEPEEPGTVTQQIQMAWHFDPREMRDRTGRWARSEGFSDNTVSQGRLYVRLQGESAAAADSGQQVIAKQLDNAAQEIRRGEASGFAMAAGYVGNAAAEAARNGRQGQAEKYLKLQHQLLMVSRDTPQAGSAQGAVLDLVKKAAPVVPGLLGGGHETWNGQVSVFPAYDNPGVIGELDWNARMSIEEKTAGNIQDAVEHPDKLVSDPAAFEVILHELVHGIVPEGENYAGSKPGYKENYRAYQELTVAQIEEGFTELGSIHHAPEFFAKIGVGKRKLGFMGIPTPQTMNDRALALQDPVRIANGEAWGHYGWQTRMAQDWVQQVAMDEGHADLRRGTPGYDRTRELADEVNREGPAGKVQVLATQVVRAALKDTPDAALLDDRAALDKVLASTRKAINDAWAGEQAARDAHRAAVKIARTEAHTVAVARLAAERRVA